MTPVEIIDEQQIAAKEYEALKRLLGGLLLEQKDNEASQEDIAYYTRKFNEARARRR